MAMTRCEVDCFSGRTGAGRASIFQRLLTRDDIAIVAGGSPSCLRGLYRQAYRSGRLGQFIPCPLSSTEYAQGRYLEKMRRCLQQAVDTPGVGGVVIYASCIDYLLSSDYTPIIGELCNPRGIPVEVLFRGPLARRTVAMGARTEEILARLPHGAGPIHCGTPLPPPAPDFDVLNDVAGAWGQDRFLVTPGGCTGCLTQSAAQAPTLFSRMDDILLTMGCETALTQAIAGAYPQGGEKQLFLLQTAVPSFLSVDLASVENGLRELGIPAILTDTGGWTPGCAALSRFFLDSARNGNWAADAGNGGKQVAILGYSPFSNGKKEALYPGIRLLRERGYTVCFWTPSTGKSDWHWVVSSDGRPMARWASEQFGVPFVSGIPVGARQEAEWLAQFALQAESPAEEPLPGRQYRGKVVLTGEPMLTERLELFFHEILPDCEIQKALYRPAYREERWRRPGWALFETAEELSSLTADAEIFVGDPLLIEALPSRCTCIPLPHPLVSGDLFLNDRYDYFGTQGARYLLSFL